MSIDIGVLWVFNIRSNDKNPTYNFLENPKTEWFIINKRPIKIEMLNRLKLNIN